jgi:hypothetical protein
MGVGVIGWPMVKRSLDVPHVYLLEREVKGIICSLLFWYSSKDKKTKFSARNYDIFQIKTSKSKKMWLYGKSPDVFKKSTSCCHVKSERILNIYIHYSVFS